MLKLFRVFKIFALFAFTTFMVSCGAGFDYDPNTATLTFVPSQVISFGDLKPDLTANDLYDKAIAHEAKGEGKKALNLHKKVVSEFPYSTKAPDSVFRVAQYNEQKEKFKKAFDSYQTLVTTYMGTPLYQAAIERQTAIAHGVVSGEYTNKLFFFETKVPASVASEMLGQLLENAPYAESAPKSAFLRANVWESENDDVTAMTMYRDVTRKYGESLYAGESLFKIANILHKQSQKGNTNLDNSKLAIDAFDELITLYPNHPRQAEAKALRSKIMGYDVRRSLEVAQFHEKKEEFVSAIFYYREVLTGSAPGTEYHRIAAAKINELQKRVPSN
jgi:TolA-binding protein